MADTLIITKRDEQTIWVAALSGTHATDLRIASASDESTSLVGNIYIGKVRKVQKNIDAAFIEIADKANPKENNATSINFFLFTESPSLP